MDHLTQQLPLDPFHTDLHIPNLPEQERGPSVSGALPPSDVVIRGSVSVHFQMMLLRSESASLIFDGHENNPLPFPLHETRGWTKLCL